MSILARAPRVFGFFGQETKRTFDRIAELLQDEAGQDVVEYALIAALLGLTGVASIKSLGTKVASAFITVASGVTSNV